MGPMRIRGRLTLATALVPVLAGASLSGCALLDGSSRLEEALEYLPADATAVAFLDRAALADPAYRAEPDTATSVLTDAGLTDADIEWAASASGDEPDPPARVWKISDDVDVEVVAAALEEAGYERSGPRERPTFTAGEVSLALDRDEEVIVSGPDVDALLDVVADDADSLADAGRFDDLLDHADDQDALEYAALTLDAPCGAAGLGVFVPADEPAWALRQFSDEKGAEEDAEALADLLETWPDLYDHHADVHVSADGTAVRAEAVFAERALMVQAFIRRDGPFGCASGT